MESKETPIGETGKTLGCFPDTDWTQVRIVKKLSPGVRNDFLASYYEPLLVYLRVKRFEEDQAKDLTQGFCLHLFDQDFLAKVGEGKGRLRTYLLNAFNNGRVALLL